MDCCITIKTGTQYSSVLPVYQNYKSHTIALSLIASCLTPYGGGLFSHSLKPTVVRLNCSHRPFPLSDVCFVTYANCQGVRSRTPSLRYRITFTPCLDVSQSSSFPARALTCVRSTTAAFLNCLKDRWRCYPHCFNSIPYFPFQCKSFFTFF